ncbi:hypothetical protein BO70DRAFT_94013 [Aspergillus heteromorphus CBS 117.55]|uniref:PHD-type domain-containing protein n=1 Tax=Aspergillus heteromorphus CBS 117.55 TaxID=1448321 RepID=A0A317VTW1_9EURO|nr:uncharacterized protein BO70DRAFT_94013 [Aspergillus heteromorphus CBS 117.55]PWY76298.1 hypothetical protein BO70DRAFT_94013 [Aspergillus heteromorphus CBS 117.55]
MTATHSGLELQAHTLIDRTERRRTHSQPGDMSQHNGALSCLASIEAAPPAPATLHTTTASAVTATTTTSGSPPSAPSLSTSLGPSSTQTPVNSNRSSSTPSRRVHIPRLSAATTELLARVTGSMKAAQRNDSNFLSWNPLPASQNQNIQKKGRMRTSSTIIELPTAPFVYSNNMAPPAAPKAAAPVPQAQQGKHTRLATIACRPTEPLSAVAASPSPQLPPPVVPKIAAPVSQTPPDKPTDPATITQGSTELSPAVAVSPSPQLPPPVAPEVVAPVHQVSPVQPTALASIRPKPTEASPAVDAPPPRRLSPPEAPKAVTPVSEAPPAQPRALATVATRPTEPSPAVETPPPPQLPPVTQLLPPALAAKTSSPATSATKPKKPAVGGGRQRKSITNGSKHGSKRGKKRRRNNGSDGEDVIRAGDSSTDESDVAPTATQTKSGRQVNRPSLYVPPPSAPAVAKETSNSLHTSNNATGQTAARKRKRIHRIGKDAIINCLHCQRGHSPLSNSIVFCDECNAAWHQLCHDPPIGAEVVTVKEKEWFCRECRPVQISIIQPTVVRSNPSLTSGQPPSYHPLVVPRTEVGAERYADDDRRGFLSGLSHATLVELLMTISDHNPTIPMFPGDLTKTQGSKFAFRQSLSAVPTPSTSGPGTAATSTDLTSMDEANKQNGGTASGGAHSSTHQRRHEASEEESEYDVYEHRLYPRAGNGFRLSLDVDDLDILGEDPACPTFSYSLHGPAQMRAEMNESVPVWSS